MSRTRVALVLMAISVCGAALHAQTTLTALEADIEATVAMTGMPPLTIHGHYYRSADGRTREDTPIVSMIINVAAGTVTLLTPMTMEAQVITMTAPPQGAAPATGSGFVPFETGSVEGRSVTKARLNSADGATRELWTSQDLGLAMFTKVETSAFTMTRTLRNVVVHEPDSSVFQIPAGYAVTHPAQVPSIGPASMGLPLTPGSVLGPH